ncbi:MAG: MFS transporter [Actinomycetota bacterium]|nr:MFS transporter [Actinomycetota bacterium]
MGGPPSLTVQDAIDALGFGRFQRRLLLVCGVTWAADAAEILLIAFALPAISAEFGVSRAAGGLLVTATFLGMLVGAWFWGVTSDRVGRRAGFQLTVLIFAVFGALSALAPNLATLAVLRALTGFGLGGALPLDFSLYAEYLPRHNRGRNLVLLESFWALGTIAAAGLAVLLIPTVGWRPLLASSAFAAALVLWIRRRVPESPRYLVTSGRTEDASAVLAQIAQANGRRLPPGELVAPARGRRAGLATLWGPRLRTTTATLWAAWFAISFGYYGVFTWLPSVFVNRGFTFLTTYQNTLILALAQVPGYLSAAWLVERWGRRPTLAAYLAASGVFTYLFAIAAGTGTLVVAGALMSFFSLGAWGALYAYTPEVYPTEIRATGMGAASSLTRIAGALAPLIGGLLLPVSLPAALTVYAAAFLLGGLAVLTAGPETRDQALADTARDMDPVSSDQPAKL